MAEMARRSEVHSDKEDRKGRIENELGGTRSEA